MMYKVGNKDVAITVKDRLKLPVRQSRNIITCIIIIIIIYQIYIALFSYIK
jgi:hypothetical protein